MTHEPPHPSLAALEVASIARGVQVVDALVKRAGVTLLHTDPVSPGKLAIVFAGGEAEVEESLGAAREAAATEELDFMLLPHVHPAIVRALHQPRVDGAVEAALGVLEFKTIASTLAACDVALKAAETTLHVLRLARGIGGKGYFVLGGTQDAVEAALDAAEERTSVELRVGRELIARPHRETLFVLSRL